MSRARKERRVRAWRAYIRHNDALVAHQGFAAGLRHPMRTPPGYFRRVEGFPKSFVRLLRRTGL